MNRRNPFLGYSYLFTALIALLSSFVVVLVSPAAPAYAASNGLIGADQHSNGMNYIRTFTFGGTQFWSKELGKDGTPFGDVNEVKTRIYRGGKVLAITASGGAARIYNLKTKSFYAWNPGISSGVNPHSLEILPGNVIAVAATNSNKVYLYGYAKGSSKTGSSSSVTVKGVHGVQWDPKGNRLWAIGEGSNALVAIRVDGTANPKGTITSKANVTGKGHDLAMRFGGEHQLLATATHNAYFVKGGKLVPVIKGVNYKSIKSIGNFRGDTWKIFMVSAPNNRGADYGFSINAANENLGQNGINGQTNTFYKIRPYYDGNYNYN